MKFRKGNKIAFCQDFAVWEGLPNGVDFEVSPVGKDSVKLVAPGYGGKPYGNGAIYVYRGINKKRANKACTRLFEAVAKSPQSLKNPKLTSPQ